MGLEVLGDLTDELLELDDLDRLALGPGDDALDGEPVEVEVAVDGRQPKPQRVGVEVGAMTVALPEAAKRSEVIAFSEWLVEVAGKEPATS